MNPLARLLHKIRFRLYGRGAGLGQPVPPAALDNEYASGAWDHFFGPDELPRHEMLVELIKACHPRPRLLDLGCGSGRLASLLSNANLADYLGVDIAEQGLAKARALGLPAPRDRFERHDFEQWTPPAGAYDVITFNECLGYAADPLRTARRMAAALADGGHLIVSHFEAGNHAEFWARLARDFVVAERRLARRGEKTWDLRVLRPKERRP